MAQVALPLQKLASLPSYYWLYVTKLKVGMTAEFMVLIQSFLKIYQLVQKLKVVTYRQHGDLIGPFSFFLHPFLLFFLPILPFSSVFFSFFL
jgi:hypothetical protein